MQSNRELNSKQLKALKDDLRKQAYYYVEGNSFTAIFPEGIKTNLKGHLKERITEIKNGSQLSAMNNYEPFEPKGLKKVLLFNKVMYGLLILTFFTSGVAAIFGLLTALANIEIIERIQKIKLEKNKYTVPAAISCCLVYTAITAICTLFILGKFGSPNNDYLGFWLALSAVGVIAFSLVWAIRFLQVAILKVYAQVSAIKCANGVWSEFLRGDLVVDAVEEDEYVQESETIPTQIDQPITEQSHNLIEAHA